MRSIVSAFINFNEYHNSTKSNFHIDDTIRSKAQAHISFVQREEFKSKVLHSHGKNMKEFEFNAANFLATFSLVEDEPNLLQERSLIGIQEALVFIIDEGCLFSLVPAPLV